MAKIFIGDTGYKLMLGNTKIRRAYLGRDLVYSGDINVFYHITNSQFYTEPVEEGYTCLTPRSFNPAGLRVGYSFLGWRLDDEASSEVLEELKAGEEDIHLYAVYYRDFTVNFYNGSTSPTTKLYRNYINQDNSIVPKTETGDTALKDISGFNVKLGWCVNIAKTDRTPEKNYGNNETITVTSDMNLYSLYSKNMNITVINGKGTGTESKSISGVRYRQYNTSITTVNPRTTLNHNEVPGWDAAGWSIDGGATIDTNIKDGELFIMTDNYDGKVVSAVYSQAVVFTAINANNNPNVYNETRTKVCLASGIKTTDPEITLKHNTYTGWTNVGWSKIKNNTTKTIDDGKFVITSNYDDTSIYALYSKPVNLMVVNGNNETKTNTLTRYTQFNGSTYVKNPTINLSHKSLTGWSSNGWNIIKDNITKTINDGSFEVTNVYDDQTIYALYKKSVSITIVNGNNASSTKNLTRNVQYNGTTYVVNPKVTLSHTDISGLSSEGWNIIKDNVTKTINDGSFEVIETYDNKSIYALYKQSVTVTVINYNNSKAVNNVTRYIQYNGETYVKDPTITLAHTVATGWDAAGWNITKNNITADTNIIEGTFKVTSIYDGKSIYALYSQGTKVSVYNGNNTEKVENLTRYVQYNGTTYIKHPTLTLKETAISGFTKVGWNIIKDSVTKSINDNTAVSITTNYDNISFYSIYSKAVSITVVNKDNATETKSGTRYVQYNGTTYTVNPTTTLKHNTYSGWTAAGWNTTKNNIDPDTNIKDGTFEIKSTYDGKSIYALYSKGSITATIVNNDNVTTVKNLTRTTQFNGETYVIDPEVTLKHTSKSGWTNAGWSNTVGSISKTFDDGKISITESKSFYALYTKTVSVTVYNKGNAKTAYNSLIRTVQYNGNTYTVDPEITLNHADYSGWNKSGWNITTDSVTVDTAINEGTFKVTSAYDGKSIYALYNKDLVVYTYNGSTTRTTNNLKRYVQYHGTTYTVDPKLTLKHNTYTGWTNAGWNTTVNNIKIDSSIIEDGQFTVTSTYDGKTLYSLYSKPVSITVINKDNVSESKSGTRYIQFNANIYTLDPTVSIVHNTYSGWTAAGWNITKNNVTADTNITENSFKVTSTYDGKSIYALYSQAVTVKVYNASTTAKTENLTRYVQFNGTTYTKHPELPLNESTITGWTKVGWNIDIDSVTKTINDGTILSITASYDNKSFYSIYSKSVSITIVNKNNVTETKSGTRYIQYNSSTYTVNPKISISHNELSGWSSAGWNITAGSTVADAKITEGTFEVTSAYDSKTIYALYKRNITVLVVNYNNAKTTNTLTRYRQYSGGDIVKTDPEITLKHNAYSGWSNAGWSNTVKDVTKTVDDGKITVTEDKSFYAIYSKAVTIYTYNGSNSRTSNNLTRYTQFNGSTYVKDPTLILTHATVSGWENYGWNVILNNVVKALDDDTYTIPSAADGSTYYSLYKQTAKFTVYNGGSSNTVTKTVYQDTRYRQYNSSTFTQNPTMSLTHYAISGWSSNGWNFGADNKTPTIANDNSNFSMTSEYDNKFIYALYRHNVSVKWVESNTVSNTETKNRYIRANSNNEWATTDPDFARNVPSLSGFNILGWTNDTGAPSTATYRSGTLFTRSSGITLYALYWKTVTLYIHTAGTVVTMGPQNRYYNRGTSNNTIPKFTVGDQGEPVPGRVFMGWSLDTSPTISYQHFTDVPCMDDLHIYAVWHQANQILRDYRSEPNGYKSFYPDTGETYRGKIYRQWLVDIDTEWYDKVELHIRIALNPGKWATGTWCYAALFPGTIPDMDNPSMSGQPENVELRAINWWSSGGVRTDRGPCANDVEAITTHNIKPTTGRGTTSEVSYAFVEDWYVSGTRFDIWTITEIGRTRTW